MRGSGQPKARWFHGIVSDRDTGCWCVLFGRILAEKTLVEPDPANTGEGMSAAPAHAVATPVTFSHAFALIL